MMMYEKKNGTEKENEQAIESAITEERTNRKYRTGWRRRRKRRKRGEVIRGRRINRTRKKEITMRERTRINILYFVLQ